MKINISHYFANNINLIYFTGASGSQCLLKNNLGRGQMQLLNPVLQPYGQKSKNKVRVFVDGDFSGAACRLLKIHTKDLIRLLFVLLLLFNSSAGKPPEAAEKSSSSGSTTLLNFPQRQQGYLGLLPNSHTQRLGQDIIYLLTRAEKRQYPSHRAFLHFHPIKPKIGDISFMHNHIFKSP